MGFWVWMGMLGGAVLGALGGGIAGAIVGAVLGAGLGMLVSRAASGPSASWRMTATRTAHS